jgi:hypothetical protein
MKLASIIIASVAFLVISTLVYNFIKETIIHRRRMRKLKIWSQFQARAVDWADEILDPDIKTEFITQCVTKLTHKYEEREQEIQNFDEEREKLKIVKEWGDHIPSIKQEWREEQLKKIL